MVDSRSSTGLEWVELAASGVRLRAPRGSAAAAAMPNLAREAEAIYASLVNVLAPDQPSTDPVDIYLVDPVGDLAPELADEDDLPEAPPEAPVEPADRGTSIGSGGLVHIVRNDDAPGSIGRPLARVLIARWFGEDAASSSLLTDGIAGIAAAAVGMGPAPSAINMMMGGQMGGAGGEEVAMGPEGEGPPEGVGGPPGGAGPEGAPPEDDEDDAFVSILEYPDDAPNTPDGMGPPAMATSFVDYLIQSSDKGSLRELLKTYKKDRRDEAFIAIYQRPLAQLEADWMSRLMGSDENTMSSLFKFLLPLLRPHMWTYLETLLYMIVSVVFTISIPLVSGCIIDGLSRLGDPGAPEPGGFCGVVAPSLTRGRVVLVVLLLFAFYVLDSLLSIRRSYVEARLYDDIGRGVRQRMFDRLLRLSHRFYGNARVGDITARLSGDLDELQASMQQVFGGGAMLILTSMLAALTALFQSPIVGSMILLLIPVFLLANKTLGKRIAQGSLEVQETAGDSAALLQESLSAHAVIKAYGLEGRSSAAYRHRLGVTRRAQLKTSLWGQLYESTISLSTTVAQLLVLSVGAILVIGGSIDDPGRLVALLLLLPSVITPVSSLADIGQVTQMAAGSVTRTKSILDEPIDIEDAPDAVELPRLSKEIKFTNVDFSYEPRRQILKDLNLTIPAGSNVAIVGPSGSGKSTIANLLLRFWDPDDGTITIDGVDVRQGTLESLRSQIGIVFQDTFIFNSTLRDNIAIGRPDATDEEVEAAARAAKLDSFIASQPGGFDAVLGERGVRMSGGQRQRLAIARAILRDPEILILDEATSALDSRTESDILDTLSSIVRSRTTIAITHRLAMAAQADFIVVLDDGQVIEQGSHDELVSAGGLYQRLYEEQVVQGGTAARPSVALDSARLRKVPMFAGLDGAKLSALADRLVPETFASGDEIVRQGDPAEKLYIIVRGGAEVIVKKGRKKRRVNTLIEGDYFGEYALLTGEARTATVRATEPTEVHSLSKDVFTAMLEEDPEIQESITRLLDDRRKAFAAAAEAAGLAAA